MRVIKKGPLLRVAAVATGGGSTVKAVLEQCLPGGRLHGLVEVAVIVGTRPGIEALERPKQVVGMEHVPTRVVERKLGTKTEVRFGKELMKVFNQFDVDMFALLGCIPTIPGNVLEKFVGTNQHPAPPQRFGGKGWHGILPYAAQLYYVQDLGAKHPAIVVSQWVAPEVDGGSVIHYGEVPILDGDTPEALRDRGLPVEWAVQVETLRRLATDTAEETPCPYSCTPMSGTRAGVALENAKARALAEYGHHK